MIDSQSVCNTVLERRYNMQKDIRKNYLYNVIYQILNVVIPLVTAPYLARVLGAEKTGVYAYTYSIAYYFMMFAMLGVNNYGNRTCAMLRENRTSLSKAFSEIYVMQILCSIICTACYLGFILMWRSDYFSISLIMTGFVVSAGFDINWFFFGLEEFKVTTLRSIIVRLIITVCIFAFVKNQSDLYLYAIIMSFGTLASQIIVWPYLRKFIDFCKVSIRDVRRHIFPNLVLFIPVIAISLYKTMDKIMLGGMSSMEQTGYYEYTEKIMNIPLGFINALGVVMLPRMSNLAAKNDIREAREMLRDSFLFISFLSIAMAFGISAISSEFVPLFFGQEFLPVIKLLKWIAPTMVFFSFANVIRTQYLLPNKKDKSYIISVFTGAGVNLIVNYLLIPHFGAFGAVLGTLAAEMIVCLMQMFFVARVLDIKKYLINAVPFLMIGIIMFIIIRVISVISENLFIVVLAEIFVGGGIYICMSYMYLRRFKKEFLENIGISRIVK